MILVTLNIGPLHDSLFNLFNLYLYSRKGSKLQEVHFICNQFPRYPVRLWQYYVLWRKIFLEEWSADNCAQGEWGEKKFAQIMKAIEMYNYSCLYSQNSVEQSPSGNSQLTS